ncbi:FKBP-type peptidyl-prolyl cis-trans isomerase [Ectopseudomonas mendocina]|uniref:Peptidyl-prolyl cis-trans isomerase n=1 Tax=Ectopseudomonas mendocina TaxID=300 RepID=A0ABZ2RK31_ECTME
MPRFSLLFLFLLAPLAYSSEDSQDLAYSLGVKLGERLRHEVPQVELQPLLEGLRQAYRGEPLRLEPDRIEALLAEHEAKLAQAPDPQVEKAKAAERRFLALEKAKSGITALPNGILIQPLRAGNGPMPKANSKVRVNYRGYLADGSSFDQTQTPQWFSLDSVIAGWQQALMKMPVGAYWRITIPSAQAYGEEGAGDLIAPYSPLIFELELLEIRDK